MHWHAVHVCTPCSKVIARRKRVTTKQSCAQDTTGSRGPPRRQPKASRLPRVPYTPSLHRVVLQHGNTQAWSASPGCCHATARGGVQAAPQPKSAWRQALRTLSNSVRFRGNCQARLCIDPYGAIAPGRTLAGWSRSDVPRVLPHTPKEGHVDEWVDVNHGPKLLEIALGMRAQEAARTAVFFKHVRHVRAPSHPAARCEQRARRVAATARGCLKATKAMFANARHTCAPEP